MYPGFVSVVIVASAILSFPRLLAAQELSPRLDELRLGGAASISDRPISGSVHFEALFSPLPSVTAYDPNFSWIFSPRPLVGASISLQGKTNLAFAGLAWNLPISGPFFAEVSFGGMVHNQTLYQIYPDRPELTTRFLFRESIAVGFEINPAWRIIAFADHGSNGNLGYRNLGLDRVGVMLGEKLGEVTERPPTPSTPSVAKFSWTGFYAGISGGIAVGQANAVIDEHEPDQSSVRFSSVNVGGHFGYNWATGALVTGVEADISAQQPNFGATLLGTEQISASNRWLATARARMGADVNRVFYVQRLLVYATGGAAFTRVGKSYCNPVGPNICYYSNGDVAGGWVTEGGTSVGWTAGGGIEIPLAPHASTKLEYLYSNFGRLSFANGPISNSIHFSEHVLRAGISFGFSGW